MFYYRFDSNSMVQDLCLDAIKSDEKKKLKHGAIILNNCTGVTL